MFFKQSDEDKFNEQLVKLRFIVMSLNRASTKSKKKEKECITKSKKALEINDMGTAKVYAQYAIVNRNMALRMIELSCKVDVMMTQLQSHSFTNKISKDMMNTLSSLVMTFDPTITMDSMNNFETKMDDITIATNSMTDVLDNSMSHHSTNADEQELLDQLQSSLSYAEDLPIAPTKKEIENNNKNKEDMF